MGRKKDEIDEQKMREDRRFELHKTLLLVTWGAGVSVVIATFTLSIQFYKSVSILPFFSCHTIGRCMLLPRKNTKE